MKYIKDFSDWVILEENPYGSGASKKIWIENRDTNKKGIFKYPKLNPGENKITGEYWAEDLAVEIAKYLNINCAEVDIGKYEEEIGSMSYILTSENEELIEGIQFINNKYPFYNPDKFIDVKTSKPYSISMILNSIRGIDDKSFNRNFLEVVVFDCLIGNSDRHSSNWGFIVNVKTNEVRFSPLYDNGSSLTCYVNEKDIDNILRDGNRFESIVNRKSQSIIRWDNYKKPTHLELFEKITLNYPNEIEEVMGKIFLLDENIISDIINKYPNEILSVNRKKLLLKFLCKKRQRMLKIYAERKG